MPGAQKTSEPIFLPKNKAKQRENKAWGFVFFLKKGGGPRKEIRQGSRKKNPAGRKRSSSGASKENYPGTQGKEPTDWAETSSTIGKKRPRPGRQRTTKTA